MLSFYFYIFFFCLCRLMNTENNLLQTREEEGGTYERALVASEFIDWLLQEGEMGTRVEAEQLGRRLLEHGIVQHGEAAAPGQLLRLGYHCRPVGRQTPSYTRANLLTHWLPFGLHLQGAVVGIVFLLILCDSVVTCHISI